MVFLINLPLAFLVVAVAQRHVPESCDPYAAPRLDAWGGVLGVVGLGAVTYALIESTGDWSGASVRPDASASV
jgi:hypothetical protein